MGKGGGDGVGKGGGGGAWKGELLQIVGSHKAQGSGGGAEGHSG